MDRQGLAARSQFLLLLTKQCSQFAICIVGNSIIRAWLEPESLKNIALESYEASFLLLKLQQQGVVTLTGQHLSEVEGRFFTSLRIRAERWRVLETDVNIQFLYQTYHTRPEVMQRYSTVWQYLVAEGVQRQLISPEALTLRPDVVEQKMSNNLKQLKKEINEGKCQEGRLRQAIIDRTISNINEEMATEEEIAHRDWKRQAKEALYTGEERQWSSTYKAIGLGFIVLLSVGLLIIGVGPWFTIPLVAQVLLIAVGSLWLS